jgi:hypothetical protein
MASRVLVTAPARAQFEPVRSAVKQTLERLGLQYVRLEYGDAGTLVGVYGLPGIIESCDLVIADISTRHPMVFLEVGAAIGQRKPVLYLTQPSFVGRLGTHELVYRIAELDRAFDVRLEKMISALLGSKPGGGSLQIGPAAEAAQVRRQNVFVSYCHVDRPYLQRVSVHLKPIEQRGLVELWADTKLLAGDKWRNEIAKALSRANIALLLVSADFLASEFITKYELPALLAMAESQGTRIVPLIVKPCGFTWHEQLRQFQSINDPARALIGLSEAEQETVYAKLAEMIRDETSAP